jgi:Coenzyme PQQ synthesis protein D (PqqD)
MTYKPEVRDGLTIREIGEELVVYDARHRRAHCVNKMAAPILQACDGTRTVDQIAVLLSDELGIDERTELVSATLQELSQADLLTAAITPPGDLNRSRRNLLHKAAVIGFTFPVIESIIAQSAKAHDSASRGGDDWHHRKRSDWDDRRSSDWDRDSDRHRDY